MGGSDIWDSDSIVGEAAMILLSPEMLSSDGFESLLQKKDFTSRLCALGVDEVHLCNSWGEAFRPSFRQIGLVRRRMPARTNLILLTATLAAGPPTTNVLNSFGLRSGDYHLIHRSNRRPDIQIIFRMLTRGLAGPAYPDFLWVLSSKRKTIIFCPTIVHGQRLALYLRSRLPLAVDPCTFIRTYNALKWSDFNEVTLRVFREDSGTMVIIATDTLMVGVDLPNVEDVILATAPDTVDEMLQKIGRAGRDSTRVRGARGIVYVTKKTLEAARKQVCKDGEKTTGSVVGAATVGSIKGGKLLNPAMARMIVADCKTVAQDEIYQNPLHDDPCLCLACQLRPPQPPRTVCSCSGCSPEPDAHPEAAPMPSISSPPPKPRPGCLTKAITQRGLSHFQSFRRSLRDLAPLTEDLPSYAYMPDPHYPGYSRQLPRYLLSGRSAPVYRPRSLPEATPPGSLGVIW